MAEDADSGRVVDETRGLPYPIEQALGRQIGQALDHGPPTSLAAPRASRRNPSPPTVPVLQVARRPAGGLGFLLEARGAASEVGGPWSRAWTIWRPRACSIGRGRPRVSSTTRPGSASSAITIRTARPPPRSWPGP